MTGATFDYSTAGPQIIIALQLLLLRLRHCAKCDCTTGTCTYSPQCPETKELWSHILECSNPACPRPGCQEAVQILKHHQGCRQQCPICSPAKCIMDLIKNQPSREGFLTTQEDWGEERTVLDRMNKLYRTMEVLKHTSACLDPYCTYDSCAKVKELFQHAVECHQRAEGGCTACRRLWGVLQLHSRQCRLTNCPVPRCQDLRNMARRRQVYRNARSEAVSRDHFRRKREVGHQSRLDSRMQLFRTDNDDEQCC